MSIVVARIAPEPISTGVTVTQYRARGNDYSGGRPTYADDPLPPVPTPVPEPVPAPAIEAPAQAFAAALIAEQLPGRSPSLAEVRLRTSSDWQPPASPLRLADRKA